MNKAEFISGITEKVNEFISGDEVFGDNAMLRISPDTLELEIADGDEDLPDIDYYSLMDLVEMTPEGAWKPDSEVIAGIAADYIE